MVARHFFRGHLLFPGARVDDLLGHTEKKNETKGGSSIEGVSTDIFTHSPCGPNGGKIVDSGPKLHDVLVFIPEWPKRGGRVAYQATKQ